MIYLDSWVWIEFFASDEKAQKAGEYLEALNSEPAVISAITLLEVQYRLRQKTSSETAKQIIHYIEALDNLTVLPVTSSVARRAARLRGKYYTPGELEMSYGDAIHLATAVMAGCDKFVTGDSDFEPVTEVTVNLL